MNRSGTGPGAVWYLLPVFIFLIAAVVVPIGVIGFAMRGGSAAFQVVVPGEKEFEIHKPGKYVLWDEVQTIYEGRTYSSSNQLPAGIQIQLLSLKTTNQVPMNTSGTAFMNVGGTVRHSVGWFEISAPGKYRLSVHGQFPQRVFYFRTSLAEGVLMTMTAVGFAGLGLLTSIGIAAVIFFKRRSYRV